MIADLKIPDKHQLYLTTKLKSLARRVVELRLEYALKFLNVPLNLFQLLL